MTTYTGKDGSVMNGAGAVGEVKGFEVTQTADTVDDTVMGDDWKTHQVLHKSWSGSVNVLFDNGDTLGQETFTIGSAVAFKGYPAGNSSGLLELSGSATVTDRAITTSFDGMVEMTLQLTGNGALAEADVV